MQTDGILRYVGYSNEPFTHQLQSNDMRNRLMQIVYAFDSSEGLKTLICIETISSKIEIITNFLSVNMGPMDEYGRVWVDDVMADDMLTDRPSSPKRFSFLRVP